MTGRVVSLDFSHQSVQLPHFTADAAVTDNLFFFTGYAPVTVITNLDELRGKVDEDEAFAQASWATGSPRERTYFIANYIHDAKRSLEVDRAALDILDSALLSAERFIRIRKQREKNRMEREAAAGGNIFYNSIEA